ncbi:MAG TPA: mechanosensitive ion channel domain-containing protein [Caulobacteraceae bacterium]
MVIGAMAALSALGLNLSSLAVFAGALGIGVGLGLQGVVKEFVSGLVLIFDGVINIGDYIEVDGGSRGMVQEIGPRATRVRNNDNIDVLVPNSRLIENPVTNWTLKGDTRRIHVPFSVAYGSDKDKVREAVLRAARAVPFTLPETESRKPQVWLVGFGDSALNFELVVWPTLDAAKRPASMHAAYTWAIEDALREADIEIPFPQRDVRIRGLFGEEGQDALRALKLTPDGHGPQTAPRSQSPNDAAEDLIRSVREEEPPEGQA